MKTSKIKTYLASLCLAGACLASTAQAVIILTPLTPGVFSPAVHTNPMDADQVEFIVGYNGDLTEVYKQNVRGAEERSFAGSYTTAFSVSNGTATITYDGAPKLLITGAPIYAVAKDGQNAPFSYVWDITGWNGTEQIKMENLWPDQGEISHVSIFTGDRRVTVPDGGASVAMMGLALGVLSFGRRFIRKA